MRLLHLPGVFRPLSDSRLLARVMRRELAPGSAVADVCTGSGALAVVAALGGADVTAVDASRRAVIAARVNARLNGVRVRAVRGDLLGPCAGRRFDLIVSNPPYVPAETDGTPRGAARAWDAGLDGRALIDRLCDAAAGHLKPGGSLLLVHSTVCGAERTLERLGRRGLAAEVAAGERGPLGPLLRERAPLLERRGLLERGVREESLVVIRGRRPRRL
jgi:release factor glutamine methyltransferase